MGKEIREEDKKKWELKSLSLSPEGKMQSDYKNCFLLN